MDQPASDHADKSARFEVRDCTEVTYMNYVVWDTLRERPVAYSCHWVEAHETAKYFRRFPPFDLDSGKTSEAEPSGG